MTLKLLVGEDATDVAATIAFGARMTWPGCEVTIATGGEEILRSFAADPPDLVVLDVSMLPPDGFEVCRAIRECSPVPILMLTVRNATMDKVRALDLGADDYLTKPFDPLELFARLRALLRRRPNAASDPAGAPTPTFTAAGLTIDFAAQQVQVRGQMVQLTTIEYRLLEELARQPGTVLSHQFLLEHVWGPEYVCETRYLKVVVRRLRQKLGDDPESPRYIQTVWGTGYRFIPHS